MPYELTFTKHIAGTDREQYINECCVGGDVVAEAILPILRETYGELTADQEDWGWFIWFSRSGVKMAVDIFCDDPDAGMFRIHLTSRVRSLLFSTKVVDTPELEQLCRLVVSALAAWTGEQPAVERLDAKYMPI